MAKIKYNTKLWVDTAANLAADTTVFKENDFIFATDSGVLKKGDGVKTYADLGSIGAGAAWGDITDKPSTFKPSAHDHTFAQVNGLQTALDGKADEGHSHNWASITGKPSTFAPSAHDHAVVADEATGLEAAETLQGLAEALSARITDLDGRVALLEVADEGGEV